MKLNNQVVKNGCVCNEMILLNRETQQRLWPKMVELMEGFLLVENKTKISATHRQTTGKHI